MALRLLVSRCASRFNPHKLDQNSNPDTTELKAKDYEIIDYSIDPDLLFFNLIF